MGGGGGNKSDKIAAEKVSEIRRNAGAREEPARKGEGHEDF